MYLMKTNTTIPATLRSSGNAPPAVKFEFIVLFPKTGELRTIAVWARDENAARDMVYG